MSKYYQYKYEDMRDLAFELLMLCKEYCGSDSETFGHLYEKYNDIDGKNE